MCDVFLILRYNGEMVLMILFLHLRCILLAFCPVNHFEDLWKYYNQLCNFFITILNLERVSAIRLLNVVVNTKGITDFTYMMWLLL